MWSLPLPQQVLLGKSLLQCRRLHWSPYAPFEVKDLVLGSYTRHGLKNCLGILHAVFFKDFIGTVATMMGYHASLAIPSLRPALTTDNSNDDVVKVL